jgi:hypothetical protein
MLYARVTHLTLKAMRILYAVITAGSAGLGAEPHIADLCM